MLGDAEAQGSRGLSSHGIIEVPKPMDRSDARAPLEAEGSGSIRAVRTDYCDNAPSSIGRKRLRTPRCFTAHNEAADLVKAHRFLPS